MLKGKKIKFSNMLILIYSVIALIVLSSFSLVSYIQVRNFTLDNFKSYGILICSDIAFASTDYLFTEAYPSLNFIVDEYSGRRDLASISITNRDEIIVAGTDTASLGKACECSGSCEEEIELCIDLTEKDEISFRKDISIDDLMLGRVVIRLSMSRINTQLRSILLRTILTGLFLLFVVVISGFLISRSVTKPLVNLKTAIKKLAEGEGVELRNEQKILELAEFQSSYNRMREQLISREDELKSTKYQAEKANLAKSVFLANISHELRTPLNGILGFTSLLRNTGLNSAQNVLVDKIESSGAGLAALIRNLLDLVELESGKCKFNQRCFCLEELTDKIIFNIENSLKNRNIGFEKSIDENCRFVCSDEERIEQAMLLMLSNSMKFTVEGHIGLKIHRLSSEYISIKVYDTGIGIEPEKQKRVFEMLAQGEEPLTKKYRGIGVGLPMVKLLAELMQGDVSVKSEPGEGTAVSLKVKAGVCSNCKDEEEECDGGTGKQLLLVEDEAVNRMYLKILLEKEGYTVKEVVDGAEAIEYFQKYDFSVILMDIGLPGINGIDTAVTISGFDKYKTKPVPIIAVTASTETETRNRCFEAGMSDFIAKPVNEQDLKNVIKKHVFG